VTKLAEDRFWVVASDTAHRHVEAWMRRHTPADAFMSVTDVTSGYAQLNVQGPDSRALMQGADERGSVERGVPVPYGAGDRRRAGAGAVRADHVPGGSWGYELYIPAEQATHVYDRIVEVGARFGLRHAGLKALASLRMEKAYRDYGHDIDNTDSPLEAGLGFAVDLKKSGGFVGKEAVLAQKTAGPLRRRLVQILVQDPEAMMFHAEIVLRDGVAVGYVRAASYGHTLGGAVGLAMVAAEVAIDQAWLDAGRWQVAIAERVYPAIASLRPLYDPSMARIKA
jgi:glycine cleavage system aminomethyltransferase T